MATIFLSGALSDWDDPFEWHEEVAEEYPDHEFVNPYTLNDYEMGDDSIYDRPELVIEPAEEAVRESDGVLCRWEDEASLPGSCGEMKEAKDNDIPVIIWYDGPKDRLSPALQHWSRANFSDRDKCVQILLSYIGQFELSS